MAADCQHCYLRFITLASTNRELEPAFERQRHGMQSIAWIVNEFEVLAVCVAKLQRVVADYDRAIAKFGATKDSAGRAIGVQISMSMKSIGPSTSTRVSRKSPSRRSMNSASPDSAK